MTLDPELTRAAARVMCIICRASHGRVPFWEKEEPPKKRCFSVRKSEQKDHVPTRREFRNVDP